MPTISVPCCDLLRPDWRGRPNAWPCAPIGAAINSRHSPQLTSHPTARIPHTSNRSPSRTLFAGADPAPNRLVDGVGP
jgi:hypothetical protein